MLLFECLDLRPLHSILWKGLHLEGAGRPVEFDPECDLRALLLRQLEQIPYVKDLVKRLRRNKEMRSACGYDGKVPTEAHFSQMKKRIGVEGFRAIEEWLRHEALRLRQSQPLSAAGLIQAVCVDGTDLPAWTNRARAQLPVLNSDFDSNRTSGTSIRLDLQKATNSFLPWQTTPRPLSSKTQSSV